MNVTLHSTAFLSNAHELTWHAYTSVADEHPFQFDNITFAGCTISFLIAAISNAVGVGGGSFFVLLLNLLLGFSIKSSTAMSQAIITGGALASVCLTAFKTHPQDSKCSLIDWHHAALLLPPLLLGISAGVVLNRVLPGLLITFILQLLLSYLGFSTLRKSWQLRKHELAAGSRVQKVVVVEEGHGTWRNGPGQGPGTPPRQAKPTLVPATTEVCVTADGSAHGLLRSAAAPGMSAQPEPVIKYRFGSMTTETASGAASEAPSKLGSTATAVLQLLLLWCSFMGLQILKSGVYPCSWLFAELYGAQVLLCALVCGFVIAQRLQVDKTGAEPLAEPLLHNAPGQHQRQQLRKLLSSCGLAALGGMLAGLTGLGGGMVLGPLMLHLGLHPQVTAATSGVTVLFSSSCAALTFLLSGRLNVPYAAVFTVSCMAGALVGVKVISHAVRRSGAASLVALILSCIMLLSALLAGWAAVQGVVAQVTGTHISRFHSLCDVD